MAIGSDICPVWSPGIGTAVYCIGVREEHSNIANLTNHPCPWGAKERQRPVCKTPQLHRPRMVHSVKGRNSGSQKAIRSTENRWQTASLSCHGMKESASHWRIRWLSPTFLCASCAGWEAAADRKRVITAPAGRRVSPAACPIRSSLLQLKPWQPLAATALLS